MSRKTFRSTRARPQAAPPDPIEAAIGDLDPEHYPQDRVIAERWGREALLPPLADERGADILGDPEGTLDLGSDLKAQFRACMLVQPGGRELYSDWILARMRARERKAHA